jgi:hypothetical protein
MLSCAYSMHCQYVDVVYITVACFYRYRYTLDVCLFVCISEILAFVDWACSFVRLPDVFGHTGHHKVIFDVQLLVHTRRKLYVHGKSFNKNWYVRGDVRVWQNRVVRRWIEAAIVTVIHIITWLSNCREASGRLLESWLQFTILYHKRTSVLSNGIHWALPGYSLLLTSTPHALAAYELHSKPMTHDIRHGSYINLFL